MGALLKYSLYIQIGIWSYFVYGAIWRNFIQPFYIGKGQMNPITWSMTLGLVSFQLIRDLW